MEETLEIMPIDEGAILTDFDCGSKTMNVWLRRRAVHNQIEGYTKTYLAYLGDNLVGYYSLCSTTVLSASFISNTNGAKKINSPNTIPCFLIARLAVDKAYQRKRIGSELVKDAFLRILQAESIISGKAIIVDLLEENGNLKQFYSKLGFQPLDGQFTRYYLPINKLKAAV